jgi:Flp pilus assembly pilin Flp
MRIHTRSSTASAAFPTERIVPEADLTPGDERGASMLEYAFLVALIAIVVVTAALFFGERLSSDFSDVGETMQAV